MSTLPSRFFDRPTLRVARELLGKQLVRRSRGRLWKLTIMEVEAYDGPRDRASHASRGRTPRTAVMFGRSGRFYVYFTYGMHWLLNVVTGPEGYPAAILLRGGAYRDPKTGEWKHIDGPARLTRFLKIDGKLNAKSASRRTGLWFENGGTEVPKSAILARPRVGVDYAGEWARRKWNFKFMETRSP
jgi:DNA-3-methyladenine glycosylase